MCIESKGHTPETTPEKAHSISTHLVREIRFQAGIQAPSNCRLDAR